MSFPERQAERTPWENLVACCRKDNHRKADRTPEEAGHAAVAQGRCRRAFTLGRFILRSMGLEVNEWRRYLYADDDGDRRFAVRG